MTRLVPNPQALIDQLVRLIAHPSTERPPPGPDTDQRILDAALQAFSAQGVRATTMSQIARDAGISREWLYKRFANRDAIVLAVARREATLLIDGLVARAFQSDNVTDALTDAFVYSVEFLRDNEMLQRVLATEADIVGPGLVRDAAPVVGLAVRTAANYLGALDDVDPDDAIVIAETIIRLAASIAIVPKGVLDLHEPDELRRYAATIIPAVLAVHAPDAVRPRSTAPAARGRRPRSR